METMTGRRPLPIRLAFGAPLLFVNAAAMYGQSIWLQSNITNHNGAEDWFFAIALAFAVESIATYLALEAHQALMSDQAAGSLRLGSYVVAAVVAGLNYAHFAKTLPSAAVFFALLSMVSPWLWSVKSRSDHRAHLAALGQVDPRGVKLSTSRKFWHPFLSMRVMSWASWVGESHPERAVAGWNAANGTPREALQATLSTPVTAPAPLPVALSYTFPQLEAESEQRESRVDTETETERIETVTRTRTRSLSRQQARVDRLRERVEKVQAARPDWQSNELKYSDIGEITGLSGAEPIKQIYAVLYRGETVESLLLAT